MNIILLSLLFFIFAIFTMKYKEKKKRRIFLDAGLFFLFGLMSVTYFVANYFTGEGINETVIASLNLGLASAGFAEYFLLIAAAIFSFIILFVMAFAYYHHLKSVVLASPKKIKAFIHNGFFILAFATHPLVLDIKDIYHIVTMEQEDDFYDYYKVPKTTGSDLTKKNIVFIYAESLERTYFDTDIFPGLMPHLSELIKNEKTIEFTNMMQTTGSNYTIAGITSTQCGIPLFTTSGGNSMEGVDKFYQEAICLGDVLKKEKYYLSFLQGASIKFAGKDKFFKTHSFDTISGKNELLQNLEDKSYVNGWGLYDDTLLSMAYDEFETLSLAEEQFALFVLTLDTHHPNGHLSQSCSQDLYLDGKNDILNTVKCSDKLISEFIQKIQKSKYAKNTLIVLASDHLAMRNTAIEKINTSDTRRNLFVVFDPSAEESESIDDVGTPFDVASTVLSFVGITTDLGLGRNIRTEESLYTLFDDYDQKLNKWRGDILSFWKFPKMSEYISVDLTKMSVNIGANSYKFPVLFRVLETNIEPYFHVNYSWKLYEQLQNFNENDKFLWVDECDLLNYIFDANASQKYCIAEGTLGVNYKVEGLSSEKSFYKTDDYTKNATQSQESFETIKSKIEILKNNGLRYTADLEEGMIFTKEGYPSFLKNIQGVSYVEEFGRWTDARLHPSALFTFEEPLPKKFTLEIISGAYGQNIGNKVKVKIANQVRTFVPNSANPKKYLLKFENLSNAKTIEIIPPKPFIPKNSLEGSDDRKRGLSLISLKVVDLQKK